MTEQELLLQIWNHVQKLNDDYTLLSASVAKLEARMDMITAILAVIGIAILGQFISYIWKKIINGKK